MRNAYDSNRVSTFFARYLSTFYLNVFELLKHRRFKGGCTCIKMGCTVYTYRHP